MYCIACQNDFDFDMITFNACCLCTNMNCEHTWFQSSSDILYLHMYSAHLEAWFDSHKKT